MEPLARAHREIAVLALTCLAIIIGSGPDSGLGSALGAGEAEEGPCGIPPPGKPRRIKGGEGIPPLPLPATPLRRSERKRDPAPPLLLGKVTWGRSDLVWRYPDGRTRKYSDWNLDPNDLPRLLQRVTAAIGTKYRSEPIDLSAFSFDPREVPILFVSGSRPFRPEPETREMLVRYMKQGGTVFTVAHHGSDVFTASIRELAGRLFPERPWRVLPPDHPVYRSWRRLDRVRYTSAAKDHTDGAPRLEGVSIGCRAAFIHSAYDLNCEWDSDHLQDRYPGVKGEDAFTLGINVIAYAVACFPLGQFYGRWGLTEIENPEVDRGDFVFAQVRHSGDYDPNPTAFAELLSLAMRETSIGARLRRKVVRLTAPDLADHPFLYMTGHGDFRLSDGERAALRRFLTAGGFLLADSCCGNLGFDLALRRELALALPGSKLEPLGADDPLLDGFYTIEDAEYTTAARASFPRLEGVFLEGVEISGALRVVYSRFDLGNGWEGQDHPFALGYRRETARRIGVNAIVHALTH